MAETFELVGRVVGLEQKRYRDGRGPIPGFWTVKLQTEAGERSCSFNSDVRKNPRDPNREEDATNLVEATHEVAAVLEEPGENSDGSVADGDELRESGVIRESLSQRTRTLAHKSLRQGFWRRFPPSAARPAFRPARLQPCQLTPTPSQARVHTRSDRHADSSHCRKAKCSGG
jgi:hypothetical protein